MSGNLCLAPVQHSALVVGQHWLISALKRIACCFSYLALLLVCSLKGKARCKRFAQPYGLLQAQNVWG